MNRSLSSYALAVALIMALVWLGWGKYASAQTDAPPQAEPDKPNTLMYIPVITMDRTDVPSVHPDGKTLFMDTGTASIALDLHPPDDDDDVIIESFAPANGTAGDTITLHGHFIDPVAVLFGLIPAQSFTLVDEHTITVIVPPGAQSGRISVITLSSSFDTFTIGGVITPTATPVPTLLPETATPVPTATVAVSATATVEPTATEPVLEPTETPGASTPTLTAQPPTATQSAVTPTSTPIAPQTPSATPVVVSGGGIWIDHAALMALPMSGPAWAELVSAANGSTSSPNLSNQDDATNVNVMAAGLACARTGDAGYCNKVTTALQAIATGNSENGSRALALGRELAAYVIAADLINLHAVNPALDAQFRSKIAALRTFPTSGGPGNLIECQEQRPNNWGRHCAASRIAVDLYLGDTADLARAAVVFHGWLGDRSAYAGFKYGDLSWQADPANPVGINPVGSTIQGHDVSGAQPDDMRRGGSFHWPPSATGYAWEGLQGGVAAAHMLDRAGYPAWQWEDKAMLRAVQFLYGLGWPAEGDDRWQIPLINEAYGTSFPEASAAGAGKNIGWTAWTSQ